MKEHLQSAAGFMVFLIMCLGAQLTSSFLTMPAIRSGWYAGLEKPFFSPPDWLFAPVWTALYFTMAVAAWMVWRLESEDPLVMRRPGWALMEIVWLWLLIVATVLAFVRINRWAALLLVPYLGWVLYSAVLNGAIWWLNRSLAGSGGG